MIHKIGLFDSGVGGLTVLREMVKNFPDHSFAYLGDTARLPYGTKSQETLERYVQQNIEFLKRQQVDLVISACHTASSTLLKKDFKSLDVPIFEVITPSCKEALKASTNKSIGIMGTLSTVRSEIYPQTLKKLSPEVQVFQQACPLLVPLVESGWIQDSVTDQILKRYLNPLLEKGVDSIILGCTHYPLLSEPISKICGPAVTLIDPAQTLASHLSQTFANNFEKSKPQIEVFLTDHSPHFLEHSKGLMGEKISETMQLKSPDLV